MAVLGVLAAQSGLAWDYEGHRVVNQLALSTLPATFPAFALTAAAKERIAFLSGDPDRWRNADDPTFNHLNGPDHYIDLDNVQRFGIDPHDLPKFRYDFVAAMARARAAHPEVLTNLDVGHDVSHTSQVEGFLPWEMVENFDKLKSEFSTLKALEQVGTKEEIENEQQSIVYTMGVMGHYVGDSSQPLHVTKYHHGWRGDNPNHYTTDSKFHGWIDGGYFKQMGGVHVEDVADKMKPAKPFASTHADYKPGDLFKLANQYLCDQLQFVEPLYRLEKDGKLTGEGETGKQGMSFLKQQLATGAQLLGDMYYNAWLESKPDSYLIKSRTPAQ